MIDNLKSFIRMPKFPCIMAKSVDRIGHLEYHQIKSLDHLKETKDILQKFYNFIEHYRNNPETLHSFFITLDFKETENYLHFEKIFWNFMRELNLEDKKIYSHDPRVDSDPFSSKFSFSLGEEAFFILALHPNNPRFSRRYSKPSIVFNPHQQFEDLRQKGIYKKIRDTIRNRDAKLQGNINPMLNDFGAESEIYQYMGRMHDHDEKLPLIN